MGTYKGLSVPMFGEYYRYSADQTQCEYVSDTGARDLTFTSAGADNLLSIVHTDSNTLATGYLQNFYGSLTGAGTYTTGNSQLSVFAADLILTGTVSCEAQGMYVYVNGSGTLTSGNVTGINVYIDDLGGTVSSKTCMTLHFADGNAAAGQNAFICMRLEGGSGACNAMFQKAGTATNPTYFLTTNATNGMIVAGDFVTSNAASDYGLAVYVNGAVRYIPLVINT